MHPLDMLTGDEIERAVAIVRAHGRLPDDALFAHIVLHEPDKADARAVEGRRPGRSARCACKPCPGPDLDLVEIVVSVTQGEVRRVARGRPGCARRC